jgi:hypothetical protein
MASAITACGTGADSSCTEEAFLYCLQGICPKGYYCGKGTAVPVACPAGYYSESIGVRSSSECLTCMKGYYCSGTQAR